MQFTIFLLLAVASLAYGQAPPPIAILRQASDVSPDGSYKWSFEAENGISAEEQGHLTDSKEPGTAAEGGFKYTAPDGTPIAMHYVADENGFQPVGDHLPVAPPIPEAIARALAWSEAHPSSD